MSIDILITLIFGVLGLLWLLSPLLVFLLLSRTNRLERQVMHLRRTVQDLASRTGAATEPARADSYDAAAVGNESTQSQILMKQRPGETASQPEAGVVSAASALKHPPAATVAPAPALSAVRPAARPPDQFERHRPKQPDQLLHEEPRESHRDSGEAPPEPAGEVTRKRRTAGDGPPRLWEMRLGADWLNRIGGLLLVIGITLFVGYSLQQLGPRGRLALGAVVSLGLLGGGVFAGQWRAYHIFSASLVATGWAGLYVTAYAAHGVPASRVIEHPLVALGVMVAVAAGMVSHSLLYRVPLVTALAYLFGFVAIGISPVGLWSACGCVLLAVSMLVVSIRFRWDQLAVAGILCTYGTLLLRAQEMLVATPLWQGFTAGHLIVLICWLAFESYDILMLAGGPTLGIGRAILPLNFCFALAAAVTLWPDTAAPGRLAAGVAVAYAVSTLSRLAVRKPAAFGQGSTPLKRGILGGYEATVTVAAIATAVTIWSRFPDAAGWRLILLLAEAESLYLLGVVFQQPFLQLLAAAGFACCLVTLQQVAADDHSRWSWGVLTPLPWVPHAIGLASVFGGNRAVAHRIDPRPQHSWESLFSYAATGLLTSCVAAEGFGGQLGLEPYHLGAAAILVAWLLLQLAIWADLDELFIQMQLVGITGGFVTLIINGLLIGLPAGVAPVEAWGWLPPAAIICGGCGWQLSRGSLPTRRLSTLAACRSVAVAASLWLTVLFFWHLLPAPAVAVAWMLMAMLILAAGERLGEPSLRLQGHALCLVVAGRLFLANFTTFALTAGISQRLLTVPPIAAAFAFLAWWSPRQQRPAPEAAGTEAFMRRFCLHFATLAVAVLLRFELGRVLTLPAWALLGVALLLVEKRWVSADLRLQPLVLGMACFARSWSTQFFIPEGSLGASGPAVIGTVVILCLFAGMLLSPRPADPPAPAAGAIGWVLRQSRVVYAAMATVLWALLVYHEVPWRATTAAWGLEGALLVGAGFALRDRIPRLAGLAVLGLSVSKLFVYDLRNLDTPARIASFVLLGAVLIAASWAYTRFRSQVDDLLETRRP